MNNLKMKMVDTRNDKNRIRHYGLETRIPVFIDGKEKQGTIFSTKCGKFLRHYQSATLVSANYCDGSRFSTYCAVCLPFEAKSQGENDDLEASHSNRY